MRTLKPAPRRDLEWLLNTRQPLDAPPEGVTEVAVFPTSWTACPTSRSMSLSGWTIEETGGHWKRRCRFRAAGQPEGELSSCAAYTSRQQYVPSRSRLNLHWLVALLLRWRARPGCVALFGGFYLFWTSVW